MNKITYLFIAVFCLVLGTTAKAQVVINEVMSSNTTINEDEDGDYNDWVELHNVGGSSVNLNGFGLTDDATIPYKWTFPAVTLAPGSYLLVWCSDKDRAVAGQPLHTNWKISSAGEAITLTNAVGNTLDTAPAAETPPNISWGRIPNGTGGFMFIQEVTPGAANGAVGYNEILTPPTFSQAGGFSVNNFQLTLSTDVPGASIIYTIDGSEPVSTNLAGTTYQYRNQYIFEPGDTNGPLLNKSYETLAYSAPINIVNRTSQPNDISMISTTFDNDPFYLPSFNIFKGTVVRARTVKPGALPSDIVTNTYFVFPEGAAKFGVPVISLSTNEDRLFDYEDGVFVAGKDFDDWRAANPNDDPTYEEEGNFEREGVEFEKRSHFSYFVNGVEEINQDMGIRVRGGHSRTFPSKSMSLYAREDYGDGDFDYKFFDDNPYDSFERLVLRNGGGDFYGSTFRDDMNQRACAFLHCEYESSQPAVAFLNGEYWGILNVREKYDNNYFKQVYGFDDIDLLEDGYDIEEGDSDHWDAMTEYFETHTLASDSEYDYIVTQLDPESFADYYIANIYMDNVDWPGTNTTYWRKRVPYTPDAPYGADGRWRWAFHDMDDTLSITSESISHNNLADATATDGPDWPNPPSSTLFLRKMLNNNTFKTYFINRFADLMNSHWKSERLIGILNDFRTIVEPEMENHYPRWQTLEGMTDFEWVMNTETDFFNQRPAAQRNHIRAKFGIANNINATLEVSDPEHGYVKINTIEIKDGTPGIDAQPYPWTGVYFSNIPVTLKAIANPGYVFSHWTGASTATTDEITITSASAFSVTAVFIPQTVAQSEPIYFWYMGTAIPNDTPLTTLATTFEAESLSEANISYMSSLPGYPYTSADPLWRHGSMERRNKPTPINYIPEANGDAAYVAANMRGLQITEPLHNGALENTMVFNVPTSGFGDIKFSFAAINEATNATGIAIDYSTVSGEPDWTTAGLTSSNLPLTAAFQLFDVDFSSIDAAENNADFKVRLRFTGTNMEVDNGNRITFNNIAVHGTELTLGTPGHDIMRLSVFPNPTSGMLSVGGTNGEVSFNLFTMDGRLVKTGKLDASAQLSIEEFNSGLYLLQLTSEGRTETKKIIKK